jgi:hypothetical protein
MKHTIHSRLLAALFLILLMTSAGWTEDAVPADDDAAGSLLNEEDLNQLTAEPPGESSLPDFKPLVTGSGFIGQNVISNNEAGNRAYPYGQLRPSLIGGGALTLLDRHYKVDLDGNYLSDSDNQGSLAIDFGGHYRVFLNTEALFHNIPAERYGWDTVRLSNGNVVNYDLQPATNASYGITVRQDQALLRGKPTDYPFHFDLGFRRLTREGTRQLRFADVQFAAPTNTIYNRSVTVDQAMYEGTAGVDAHLGYIDIVNQFQIRQFVDHQAIPQQVLYQPQFNGATLLRNGGFLQHNENPDSRYWANTLRLHTSISGGLVGALSYTYGQRQSFSSLTDISGAAEAKTILRNMAGDLTYTPVPELTASVKYRRQVTEYELPPNIVRLPSGGGTGVGDVIPLQVPVESRLDSLTSALVYRPINWLVLKGEFKGDFVRREADSVGQVQSWLLQHQEDRYQGRVTAVATPIKGLRLKGLYGYAATSNPLYKTTFDDKHFGELIATYNRANLFGTSLSYRETSESMPDAQRKQRSVTTNGWVNPLPRLTLNASFAYLQTGAERVVEYPVLTVTPNTVTNFTVPGSYQASSHIYGISAIVHPIDQLDVTVGYQQVRSDSVFNPGALPNQPVASSLATYSLDGISDLSRTQTVEHEVTTRIDYRVTTNLSSTVEYLYRVIHDHVDSSLNGGAHQIMASVGFKW